MALEYTPAERLQIFKWHYARLRGELPDALDQKQSAVIDEVCPMVNIDPITPSIEHDDLAQQSVWDAVNAVAQNTVHAVEATCTQHSVYDYYPQLFTLKFERSGKLARTSIELEQYVVAALQRRHGLSGKTAVRQWLEQAVRSAGVGFDAHYPVTKQVRRFAIESLIK